MGVIRALMSFLIYVHACQLAFPLIQCRTCERESGWDVQFVGLVWEEA